jgi:hypothetical protein
VSVTVSDANGPINGSLTGGTITFTVLNSSGTAVTGGVTVPVNSVGQASATLTLPSNLAAGSYTVQAVYNSTNGQFNNSTSSEALTITPAPVGSASTTLVPGNGSVPFSAAAQVANIPVLINSPSATVNTGSVTVTLLVNGIPVSTATGTVTNGQTTVALAVPPGEPAGSYTLTEVYSDNTGHFVGSSGFGTLTVVAPATSTSSSTSSGGATSSSSSTPAVFPALFTVAFDAAELTLEQHGVFTVGGVALPPQSLLLAEISANFPFTDGLGSAALNAGIQAATQALAAGL